MSNGIRRTPFDTIDLGGQLLQALVAAEGTKRQREQLKLQEKELELQTRQQQLEAAGQLAPGGPRADILSQILGQAVAPEQIQEPIAERQYNDLQKYLNANPDIREMHLNIQATGQPFGALEGLEAARIANRLKLSPQDRVEAGFGLLQTYGGPAAAAFNLLSGRELGVRAPAGAKTLAEQGLDVERTQARAAGAGAEAARVRARQDLIEFLGGGFVKLDPNLSDEDFDAAVGQLVDWSTDPTGAAAVDPSVFRKVAPTSKAAAILAAGAKISPLTEAKMEMAKFLGAQVEKLGDDAPQETIDLLQRYLVEIDEELHPQGGTAPPPASAAVEGGPGPGEALAAFGTARPLTGLMRTAEFVMGAPIKPALRSKLEAFASFAEVGGQIESFQKPIAEWTKRLGSKIGTALFEKPPETLGPLSTPEIRKTVPREILGPFKSAVAAFRQGGASEAEARQLEQDIVTVLQTGSLADFKELLEAITDDLVAQRSEQ